MPRYFFDTRDGPELLRDGESLELEGIEAARQDRQVRVWLHCVTSICPLSGPEPVAMHIDDIKNAIAAQDTATIKKGFHALLNEDQVGGLTAGNAMIILDALTEVLKSDQGVMPRGTSQTLGLTPGSSYEDGVAAVHENRRLWSSYFATRFKRVSQPKEA